MGLTEFLAAYITQFINSTGYVSVFILMAMESMVFPIPSEAVMPFAGFLIAQKVFSFFGVIFWSTFGSIVGSLISYYMGFKGGKPFVNKYGKYFLLNNEDLEKTENFFKRRGEITIFISRFIPVIRHLISLPAGIAKMDIFKFSLYTIIGAGLWNTFLAVMGFYLRQNWEQIMTYGKIIDVFVLILLIVFVIIFIYKHLKRKSVSNI